jgi:hypothetical protein
MRTTSSGQPRDELPAAIDVEGRAGDSRVRHQMERERCEVGRADHPADRQGGAKVLAALLDGVPRMRAESGVSTNPAATGRPRLMMVSNPMPELPPRTTTVCPARA